MVHTLYDICIKAFDKGIRPNMHFDKAGWKFIITTFKDQTGHAFIKSTIKE